MAVKTSRFSIEKHGAELYVTDMAALVNKEIEACGAQEGVATIFVPGPTAGVTTIEYEPNLLNDLKAMLERITPSDAEYEHSKIWGENNGKSHLGASMVGPGASMPFAKGEMELGEWQQLVVMDFDTRSRKRDVLVSIVY